MRRAFAPQPWDDDYEPPESTDTPHVEVEIDDLDVIGVILGPDGQPLHTVLERDRFPFGFNPT